MKALTFKMKATKFNTFALGFLLKSFTNSLERHLNKTKTYPRKAIKYQFLQYIKYIITNSV